MGTPSYSRLSEVQVLLHG
uniref:Uncharacterized protein n=1 Tax=Anguilla anguilla TaxID=7936 RepID=A0A0E9SC08_ANGAN